MKTYNLISDAIQLAKMSGMVNDPMFRELLRDAVQFEKIDLREKMAEIEREQIAIMNSTGFEIAKIYRAKNYAGELCDIFPVEDYETAVNVFESYRGIGHSINLLSVCILLNGKKIKKIKFMYSK